MNAEFELILNQFFDLEAPLTEEELAQVLALWEEFAW